MSELDKNPINQLVAVLGPKTFWPKAMYNLIYYNTRYATKEHLVQMLAFFYVNGVSRKLALRVLKQTGVARLFVDVDACTKAVFDGWKASADLQQAFAAYYIKSKAYHTLDKKFLRSGSSTILVGQTTPKKVPNSPCSTTAKSPTSGSWFCSPSPSTPKRTFDSPEKNQIKKKCLSRQENDLIDDSSDDEFFRNIPEDLLSPSKTTEEKINEGVFKDNEVISNENEDNSNGEKLQVEGTNSPSKIEKDQGETN